MSHPWVVSRSRLAAPDKERFARVHLAILAHGSSLRAVPGVVGLRPGFRFRDGWITDEPAVVVTVIRKLPPGEVPAGQMIPRVLEEVAVDVTQADVLGQLRAESVTRDAGAFELPPEHQPALPAWEEELGASGLTRSAGLATRAATQPYVAPSDVTLNTVEGAMTITCHASPDAGWPVLGPFLAATRHRLTVGMFDFSAPHVLEGLRAAMAGADGPLRLVLDPGLTLHRSKDAQNPKALDVTEDVVIDVLRSALGGRFMSAWAAVKRTGKTTGGVFASAYHIKVAVRDGTSFWLSSGNWQSSNQPDPERLGLDVRPDDLLRVYNREWHVVVEHPGLARVFEQFLQHDMTTAVPLQRDLGEAVAGLPDVFVPVDDRPPTRGFARLFEPRTFTFTAENPVRVQPLLTPDNYAGLIEELIRSARTMLYFQNQYISVARLNAGPFADLVEALKEKVNDGAIDARIILRESGDTRAMLEALKAQGFRTDRIRLQRTCHNKGIVVDGRAVALGSHNWSSDGTTANRDATLIIHSPEVARYYEAVFLDDWEQRARSRIVGDRPRGMPQLAQPGEPTPPGMVRLSWGDYIEDAGEAARVATLALTSTKMAPATAAARPSLPEVSPTRPAIQTEAVMSESPASKTLHALLVGIDRYESPVPRLNGCVNDVDAFEAYLRDRAGGTSLRIHVLRNEQATRDAIIAGFRERLAGAGRGDVALFYYAGHGSQEQAPEAFWHLEPDRLDETLVCYDSRKEGGWDLADKELAALIDEVAGRGAHVLVVLDCCHSGSGTRSLAEQATAIRRAPTDLRPRPLETFLVGAGQAEALANKRGLGDAQTAWPVGKHVLLAACRDEQEASEYNGEGKPRGAFSYFLGDTLRSATGPLTYRDLFARINALLSSVGGSQCPQLEATNPDDLNALFLDGTVRSADPYHVVSRTADGWCLHAGAVHGLPGAEGAEGLELSLFPLDAAPEVLRDRSKAVGTARVLEVKPTNSRVAVEGVAGAPADAAFKAVVVTYPLPAMSVRLEGPEPEGILLARQALAAAGAGGGPSLYVREARPEEAAEFRLIARGGQYVIARPADDRPIVGQLDGLTEANARKAVGRLEHIARWTLVARLRNPASTIRPEELNVAVVCDDKEHPGPEIRLDYERKDGAWAAPSFKIRLRNKGDRRLYVALLDLTETFRISAALQDGGSIRLDPGQEAWAYRGRPIPATVPDELWKQGVVEYRDILKVITCTEEFDARLMQQPALDLPRPPGPSPTRGARTGSLDRLMSRVQTRDLGDDPAAPIDDWYATEITFTTVRPLETTPVARPGSAPAALAGGVKLHAHSGLSARARLSPAPTASRDLGNLALPRLLRDDPAASQPFVVAPTRSGSPGLSVLELTDVQDREAVTPQEPLRLEVPATTAEGEHVLPVGFDGEFFLPLGRAVRKADGGTEVVIERLPGDLGQASLPEATRRSLGGSIKIFFQKVACGVLGREFEYPILAAAEVDETDGKEEVVYEKDVENVRARVSRARKVLLLVHGVIGDTLEIRRGMRRARVGPEKKPVDSLYDLVLTFDYENLNTPIEDVARKLKERLNAVGLGPEHGKDLTVVAHSMGGLVSRWFIEREGGNKVVRRLVMCGTPNGGSPWPSVHDWALGTLAIGLNGLATLAWPAAVVGGLVAAIERVDINLDQMQPGSPFLKELTRSPDPSVPYVMLSGDTSLSPAALVVDKTGLSPAGRLLARLLSKPVLHGLADTLFRDQTNDVAVSVVSMKDVPGPWNSAYDVRPVACDHMSYFNHKAGLDALASVLS